MSGQYILVNGQPVPEPDTRKWGTWMEKARQERVVSQTMVGDVKVSTVFLGLDHGWNEARPLIYETMVFGGPLDEEQERYSTREEAEAGHAAMIARVEEASRG
jgi:hypothetical protein